MTLPVRVGDEIVAAEYGPLTIVDTVRWAGMQENPERIHFDRDYAREHSGLRTFIASGGYRQALLARSLTDWLGKNGQLRRLNVRHTRPTFEGDTIRYTVRVTEIAGAPSHTSIFCEVEGTNQNQEKILIGNCLLLVTESIT